MAPQVMWNVLVTMGIGAFSVRCRRARATALVTVCAILATARAQATGPVLAASAWHALISTTRNVLGLTMVSVLRASVSASLVLLVQLARPNPAKMTAAVMVLALAKANANVCATKKAGALWVTHAPPKHAPRQMVRCVVPRVHVWPTSACAMATTVALSARARSAL